MDTIVARVSYDDFADGVCALAEYLIRIAVDDRHEGELSCADVERAARAFDVAVSADEIVARIK